MPTTNLQRYEAEAYEIEYPNVGYENSGESFAPLKPRTILDESVMEYRDLSLREAIVFALNNSEVVRDLGGAILRAPENVQTRYARSIQSTDPRFGAEAALSDFDTQLQSSAYFENNDRAINNTFFGGGTRRLKQDINDYQWQLSKQAATGTELIFRNTYNYDANNAPGNQFGSAWTTFLETEFRQPLLQGAGTRFNRIAGPDAQPGLINGVLIAKVDNELSQSDFELALRDFLSNVQNAYWDLYYAYRDLNAKITARDESLTTWQTYEAQAKQGRRGFEQDKEALAREQYFRFQEEVQNALTTGRLQQGTQTYNGISGGAVRGSAGVYRAERRLRYLMGMLVTDNRLIRPNDEPEMAKVDFDWETILAEAMARRPELKRQRLQVQRQDLELQASRNFLKPTLDAIGRYRWRGFGRDLYPQGDRNKFIVDNQGNLTLNQNRAAVQDLFNGNFQEWQLGVEFTVPIGFRRAHAAVQNAELRLAKERAILKEQERKIVHDLSDALSELERSYVVSQTNLNRYHATVGLVEALQANRGQGRQVDLDRLLDAQSRKAVAQSRYYLSRVEYAVAIKNVLFEKGSVLDYYDLYMADDVADDNIIENTPIPTDLKSNVKLDPVNRLWSLDSARPITPHAQLPQSSQTTNKLDTGPMPGDNVYESEQKTRIDFAHPPAEVTPKPPGNKKGQKPRLSKFGYQETPVSSTNVAIVETNEKSDVKSTQELRESHNLETLSKKKPANPTAKKKARLLPSDIDGNF